jgi:hypothetical protein
MSEHIFGVTYDSITKAEGQRRDRIASEHGGSFVGPVSIPGNRARGWFTIDNMGEPFNRRRAGEILEACGLDSN